MPTIKHMQRKRVKEGGRLGGKNNKNCHPEELCETPIRAGCPEKGIVLDPFLGAGTTALVALKQNKRFIGIELNPDYIKIVEKRLGGL